MLLDPKWEIKENLSRVIAEIENSEEFNMGLVFNDCGAPACLLGFAIHALGLGGDEKWGPACHDRQEIADKIGVPIQAFRMADGNNWIGDDFWGEVEVDKEHALKVLKKRLEEI